MEALRRIGVLPWWCIAHFAEALRLDSVAAVAYTIRGNAYRKKGDCDQAIAEYDKALDLALAYNNRGFAYHWAVSLLALLLFLGLSWLAIAYNNWKLAFFFVILFVILILLFLLPLGLAIACNNRGSAYHLAYVLPLLGLAYLFFGPMVFGSMAIVVLLLWYAVAYRFIGLAAAYKIRGDAYKRGAYDRAIKDYTKAIKLDPKDAAAYNNRGFAYNEEGAYDRAIKDFTKAIDLDPKDAAAYNNRGFAYNEEGAYDRAIKDSTKAIDLDPKDAAAYNNRGFARYSRGLAYEKEKDYAKAIAYYKKAIADFAETIQFGHGHATVYLNMGNLCDEWASLYLIRGAILYLIRGAISEYEREYERYKAKAIEAYDDTVRLCPNYKTDFVDRKFAYGGDAAVERAIESLTSKIKGIDNPESKYYEGVRSLFRGDGTNALRCFKLAEKEGYNDGANGAKLAKHLDNLTN